jgi:hypothetical protein
MDTQSNEVIDLSKLESSLSVNSVSEREKFELGKFVLIGLAILYTLNVIAFIVHPEKGEKLLDVATNMITSLATIILMSYFQKKNSQEN